MEIICERWVHFARCVALASTRRGNGRMGVGWLGAYGGPVCDIALIGGDCCRSIC